MSNVKTRLKDVYKSGLRKVFEQGQRFGFDILPHHFYSEIPDVRELKNSTRWREPYSMTGVNGTDIQRQLGFVKTCCPPRIVEAIRTKGIHAKACQRNGAIGFGPVEADFLFAFVATTKPKQIFQIGCGVSTAVCLMAAEHAAYTPEIICLEPYPTEFILRESSQGKIKLVRQKAEALDLKVIDTLRNDAVFFVDSSHTLGPAGEVSRIILEMLPRLKAGMQVHFHDIMFPYDYDRHILTRSLFFQHESILLHAFLVNNSRFSILASLSMLHYARAKEMVDCLPNYRPDENDGGLSKGDGHFPSSLYLEVVG